MQLTRDQKIIGNNFKRRNKLKWVRLTISLLQTFLFVTFFLRNFWPRSQFFKCFCFSLSLFYLTCLSVLTLKKNTLCWKKKWKLNFLFSSFCRSQLTTDNHRMRGGDLDPIARMTWASPPAWQQPHETHTHTQTHALEKKIKITTTKKKCKI